MALLRKIVDFLGAEHRPFLAERMLPIFCVWCLNVGNSKEVKFFCENENRSFLSFTTFRACIERREKHDAPLSITDVDEKIKFIKCNQAANRGPAMVPPLGKIAQSKPRYKSIFESESSAAEVRSTTGAENRQHLRGVLKEPGCWPGTPTAL